MIRKSLNSALALKKGSNAFFLFDYFLYTRADIICKIKDPAIYFWNFLTFRKNQIDTLLMILQFIIHLVNRKQSYYINYVILCQPNFFHIHKVVSSFPI